MQISTRMSVTIWRFKLSAPILKEKQSVEFMKHSPQPDYTDTCTWVQVQNSSSRFV